MLPQLRYRDRDENSLDSAGSGKSTPVAWLAHQLLSLHDADDRRVFDTILVITDRRVLDCQIEKTMALFGADPGRGRARGQSRKAAAGAGGREERRPLQALEVPVHRRGDREAAGEAFRCDGE